MTVFRTLSPTPPEQSAQVLIFRHLLMCNKGNIAGHCFSAASSYRMQCQQRLNDSVNRLVSLLRWGSLNVLVIICSLTILPAESAAQVPAILDNMDGNTTSLQLLPNTTGAKIIQQGIDRQYHKLGTGLERVRYTCPPGHSAQLGYKIPAAPVINEFRVAATVLSGQPGVQLAVRVTLPRTKNTTTGQAFELLVRDETLSRGGNWEKLVLENVPNLLKRVARVARSQYGNSIDERGAFISQIVLLVPGGQSPVDLLVDQLKVFGIASSTTKINSPQLNAEVAAPQQNPLATTPPQLSNDQGVPQIIQWQGESFEFLAKLGFDTIGMSRLPSRQELIDARKLKLSIVCPPPTPQQLTELGIPNDYDGVIAWDLGTQLNETDLEHVTRWQSLVERYDLNSSRASFITPQLYTREASRVADTLLLGRGMLGTDTSLLEYSTWLNQRRRVARPGTDIWATIDTQYSSQLSRQMSALEMNRGSNSVASYQQLAALTSATLSARSRGFYFRSETSLALEDQTTLFRSKAVELNNLRISMIEPWLASGKLQTPARSSQSQVSAIVLQVESSHLLVPINWTSTMRSLQSSRGNSATSIIVPNASESAEAYLLTLGGTQRLRKRRVTGGIQISLESFPADGFILLTDNPQAFSQVSRYLRKIAPRATLLRQELAALRLQNTSDITRTNKSHSQVASAFLAQAEGQLQNCARSRTSKTFDLAYQQADQAELLLEQCEQFLLSQTVSNSGKTSYSSTPNFGVTALPAQVQFQKNLNRAPVGKNLLPSGGFENLQTLLQSGWRHQQLPVKGVETAVRLSPNAAHSGSYCLELRASPTDVATPAPVVPSSPVWITSPPIQVKAGDIVEITGVARVPQPLIGSVDGLQIIDSLGGVDMSVRIPKSPSWKPFRLVRAVPTGTEVTVSIALTGLGTAQVDDLAIRTIPKPIVAQPTQVAQPRVGIPR